MYWGAKKRCIICVLSIWLGTSPAQATGKQAQFAQERKALVAKIQHLKRILRETEAKKKVSAGQLSALNKQIAASECLITTITQEIEAMDQKLIQQSHTITELEQDLHTLKQEYAAMIYLGAKAMQGMQPIALIFAAASFQELVQRLQYIRQYARLRQRHLQAIQQVTARLQVQRMSLENKRKAKGTLLAKHQDAYDNLKRLRQEQQQLIAALSHKRSHLRKSLADRQVALKRLDKLITEVVQRDLATQAQPNASISTTDSPHAIPVKHKSDTDFARHRGKLPWPVADGFISHPFGIHAHPILHEVKVENMGIDIQTQAGARVQAIFAGSVKTITFVPGMQNVVIIQHGLYYTVYAKLKTVSVKMGQRVDMHTPIGEVHTQEDGITELQLQVWKGNQKLNPVGWLCKQRV